jgi:hypothetical protein
MQHSFGEGEHKILLELEIVNNEIIRNRLVLNLPIKKIIYLDTANIDDFDLNKLKSDVKYKITLNGNKEEFKSFTKSKLFKDITKRDIKVVFKNKKSEMEDIKENLKEKVEEISFIEILGDMIKKENNEDLNELFNEIIG